MIKSIRRFFLICSGATLDVLERPECKTELTRYAMMGAFVALTAVFAALSGGYALYTGFKTLTLAIPAGLLWGAFIFTLDRFIVSSIRKKRMGSHLSFVEKAWIILGAIITALPRLILAGFIAITVAIPLEMKYFESEIDTRLATTNLEAAPRLASLALDGFPEIKTREKELQDLTNREEKLTKRRDLLRDQLRSEVDGVSGDGYSGKVGDGPQAAIRREEYEQVEAELAGVLKANAPEKEKLRKILDELRAKAAAAGDGVKGTMSQGNGFLARFRALNELAADESVKNLTRFLVLLLTLIETAPVFIKLLAGRGPYDDALEAEEHKVNVAKEKEISDFNSDINTDLEIYQMKCQARRQREEKLIQETLEPERAEPGFSSRERYTGGNNGDDHWSLEMEAAAKD
jgi:hypothetical protein